MQREGRWETSEDTNTYSETMKECSPCVEVVNPDQGPTLNWGNPSPRPEENRSSVNNKECDSSKTKK